MSPINEASWKDVSKIKIEGEDLILTVNNKNKFLKIRKIYRI